MTKTQVAELAKQIFIHGCAGFVQHSITPTAAREFAEECFSLAEVFIEVYHEKTDTVISDL